MAKLAWRKSPEPLYHHIINNSARTVYLTTLTSPFFVPSSAIQNHRQFGNNPEILMKSICINSSANLTQTFENSTKTKFANCAKDSLLMYLLIHLVFAWRRLAYDIYIWWNEVVNLFGQIILCFNCYYRKEGYTCILYMYISNIIQVSLCMIWNRIKLKRFVPTIH